jgi:hypothetical protein
VTTEELEEDNDDEVCEDNDKEVEEEEELEYNNASENTSMSIPLLLLQHKHILPTSFFSLKLFFFLKIEKRI